MLPIRERNRIETWRSIHDAAAELTLENGLAALTVETVVARAGCSRRTFFNYFQTKEDAVLGMTEPRVTDAELRETFDRAPGEADFERTMHVLIRILEATFLDPALRGRRQLLIERAPTCASGSRPTSASPRGTRSRTCVHASTRGRRRSRAAGSTIPSRRPVRSSCSRAPSSASRS